MALNAASHNPTAEPTGSVSGPPPPVSDGVTKQLQDATKQDAMGQSESGKDQQGNNEGQTVMGEAGKEMIKEETGGGGAGQ